jgi:16S rRNA (adenine1518-N6/adenine1519-N6)-dimethyltransferase
VSSNKQAKTGEGQPPSLFLMLKKYNLFPTRSLGQVFLIDQRVIESILNTLQPDCRDLIVEIGAGPGIITKRLAERAGHVLAVEIDRKFKPLHDELFGDLERPPEMIYEDARQANYHKLIRKTEGRLLVFGNLPYYLTTELILTAISCLSGMSKALFMVEEEAAERILAQPGTKKYGTLSMASQLFGQWRKERTVPRAAFFPKPNVTSALMALTPSDDEGKREIASDPLFHRFLTGLAQYRRKNLANALKLSGAVNEAIPPKIKIFLGEQAIASGARAEQLTPEQLGELFRLLNLSEKT